MVCKLGDRGFPDLLAVSIGEDIVVNGIDGVGDLAGSIFPLQNARRCEVWE
jgi:hypothetical protein